MTACPYRTAGSTLECGAPVDYRIDLVRDGKHHDGGVYCSYHSFSMAGAYWRRGYDVTEVPVRGEKV